MKFHFNGAGVDLTNADHIRKLQRVFSTANKLRLPMAVHVSALSAGPYGKEQAEGFLEVLSAAPDVAVQVAHLWGGDAYSDAALQVYADAVAGGDPRARNLYFDLSDVGNPRTSEADMQKVVAHIRRIGLNRMLYGSDGNPRQKWAELQVNLPLTDEEFRAIAANVAPYLR